MITKKKEERCIRLWKELCFFSCFCLCECVVGLLVYALFNTLEGVDSHMFLITVLVHAHPSYFFLPAFSLWDWITKS